jgi:hypothetical protein
LLATEREFHPEGTLGRIARADDLIYVLSIFVEAEWLLSDVQDRRAQLRSIDRLTTWLLDSRLADSEDLSCPLLDVQAGIRRARRDLRQKAAV